MLSLTCASCGKSQEPIDGAPVPTRCPDCRGILLVSPSGAARAPSRHPVFPADTPHVPEVPTPVGDLPSPFGKYHLDRVVGSGGMAVVYDARDTLLDRRVALKVMSRTKSDDPKRAMESWQRFMQEARLSANLPKHPNICTVYEAGVVEERHRFIAMEFVRGRPFSEWRTSPPKPIRDQIRVLREVAAAAHYAHEQGIIHRDLKPGNILVDEAGHPVVTDFGLAKSLAAGRAPSLTPSGFIVGSPAYMSPEQALGKDEVDRRSDVYALGAILYEVLAGRPPVDGRNPVEILSKVVEGRIEPPSQRAKALAGEPTDPVLERICMKAIARLPHARFPTAQAMAEELTRWMGAGVPSAAPPRSRRAAWVAAGAAAAVVLVAAVGFFVVRGGDPPAQRARVHVERGQEFLRTGVYRDAMGAFDQALALDPDNPGALRGRDEALRKLEEQVEAEKRASAEAERVRVEKETRERERRLLEEAEAARRPPIVVDLSTFKPVTPQAFYRLFATHAHFGSNLTAETSIALPETGEYEIVVTAGCEPAKGEFAKFRVTVDGKSLGETTLTAVEAHDYKLKTHLTAGHRRLGLEFTNDLYDPEKRIDRNLHIHGIVFRRLR